jgi:2-succinyl-5-enolpyruvyl-6-hydroxy-3-cyclohexene-1-carboxylate synthase
MSAAFVPAWVELLYRHGLRYVVLSPGSRPAPLTIAFARHEGFIKRVIPDERSAAFTALGIAKATRTPVVLVCTSGSAGLNYAPAVAEAYYSGVPLLVVTADRPPEWIDQQDGQTIRQQQLYGTHVKAFYQLPDSFEIPEKQRHAMRSWNMAIHTCVEGYPGPVHINVPLREPFYPEASDSFRYRDVVPMIQKPADALPAPSALPSSFEGEKVLIVVSQHQYDVSLLTPILEGCARKGIIVLCEIGSNVWFDGALHHQDLFCMSAFYSHMQPDVVLTVGQFILSKNVKQLLRATPSLKHYHIGHAAADVTLQLAAIWPFDPVATLLQVSEGYSASANTLAWAALWQKAEKITKELLIKTGAAWVEMTATMTLLDSIPKGSVVHLANSMPVRYANYVGNNRFRIALNRGTAGIDGSNSTAVGWALTNPDKPVYLITGDMAFFYDRNAFWQANLPKNLRIAVINNHGGGIFRMLPEARMQPELDTYFETPHTLTAQSLASEFRLGYFSAQTSEELATALPQWHVNGETPAILEVFVNNTDSVAFFTQFKHQLYQHLHDKLATD